MLNLVDVLDVLTKKWNHAVRRHLTNYDTILLKGKNNQAMQNDWLEYRFLDQPISIEFVYFSTAYEILIGEN